MPAGRSVLPKTCVFNIRSNGIEAVVDAVRLFVHENERLARTWVINTGKLPEKGQTRVNERSGIRPVHSPAHRKTAHTRIASSTDSQRILIVGTAINLKRRIIRPQASRFDVIDVCRTRYSGYRPTNPGLRIR